MAHLKFSAAVYKIGDMGTTFLNWGVYNLGMAEILRDTMRQLLPILAAAGIAGAFAFGQSLAANAGFCPAPVASPEQVGLLGGAIKALHQVARVWLTGHA